MTNDTQPMDAHLEILMGWLKDNDESGIQKREHANSDSQYMVDLIGDGEESYD